MAIFSPECAEKVSSLLVDKAHSKWLPTAISALEKRLTEGERVHRVLLGVEGMFPAFYVASDSRVIFTIQKTISVRQIFSFSSSTASDDLITAEFSYDKISSVSVERKFLGSSLRLNVMAQYSVLNMILPADAEAFASFVSQKIAESQKPSQQHSVRDIPAEIEKYANLLNQGAITNEEFQAQKKKLLSI